MNSLLFKEACDKVIGSRRARDSIGTLSEKTTHAVLKNYYEPYEGNHEIRVGGYIADIVGENGIIEIQTSQFGKMVNKLDAFLEACEVTIVHPIYAISHITKIDIDTGEFISKRKSPLKQKPQMIFGELYPLRYMLDNPRLHFKICMLEVEKQQYVKTPIVKRRRGERILSDIIPIKIIEEIDLFCPNDLLTLLPKFENNEFTTKSLSKELGIPTKLAGVMASVLFTSGVTQRVGKVGNAYLYSVKYT